MFDEIINNPRDLDDANQQPFRDSQSEGGDTFLLSSAGWHLQAVRLQ